MDGAAFEDLPTEEEVIERDFRTCACALTYVVRKRHGALGTAVEIRLCCMAKEFERIAGVEEGTFFRVIDFLPSWEWDCDQRSRVEERDGTVLEYQVGAPPRWLLSRLLEKELPIHNLENHPVPDRKYRQHLLEGAQ